MKTTTTENNLRQFGLILGLILTSFGYIHFFKHHTSLYPWFIILGGISASFAVIAPKVLHPVHIIFLKIGHGLGWINTHIILVTLYYLLLTPIGLIMRLFGKDPLNKKIDKTSDSYWIDRNMNISIRDSLKKQF